MAKREGQRGKGTRRGEEPCVCIWGTRLGHWYSLLPSSVGIHLTTRSSILCTL